MAGGLMQLVAYGAQDVYLTGNPQITFFKVVYRRHTNFAMETIEETMSGNIDFGRKSTITIIRNGDLCTNLYLKVILPALAATDNTPSIAWTRRVGHAMINSITISIGGSQIDKHYGTWMDVWYELTHTDDQHRGYNEMVGDTDALCALNTGTIPQTTLYIPLQFWFCRHTGLALPLIALQYHEVRLDFEFNPFSKLVCYTGATPAVQSMEDATLLVNYIFLDSEERKRFAQAGHEYLIEQLQFTGAEQVPQTSGNTTTGKYKLGFNHPTKELVWAVQGGNYTSGNKFLAYTHEEDWSTALDVAAQNLANGIFSLAQSGSAGIVDGTHTYANGGTVNVTVLLGEDFKLSQSNGCYISNSTSYSLCASGDLYNSSYNLASKITDVTIVLAAGGLTNNVNKIQSIQVNSHNLTVRDISIPISNWASDTRIVPNAVTDVTVYQYSNYGLLIDGTVNPVSTALIQLNGQDRFDVQDGTYFNHVQPWQHHTHTPCDGVNVYSFAIHPEQHQPSGSANLSRIDTTQLNITFTDSTFVTGLPGLQYFNDIIVCVWFQL